MFNEVCVTAVLTAAAPRPGHAVLSTQMTFDIAFVDIENRLSFSYASLKLIRAEKYKKDTAILRPTVHITDL